MQQSACTQNSVIILKSIGSIRLMLKVMQHLTFEMIWMILDWLDKDKLQLLAILCLTEHHNET